MGIYKYSDARKIPVNATKELKKHWKKEEDLDWEPWWKKGGDFYVCHSNPMWRATWKN